ncbi:MAG: aldehyde dehydrogenase family protein, partial [Bdellovibrionota bacterium]
REAIAETYGRDEGARQENKDFCRIINDRNFQRLKSLYDGTISRGAKLEAGGQFDAAQRYIAPTVVSGVTADAPLMSEEIFGPILPVITYRTLDSDVFPMLRGGDKPLSLYIFSESRANTETILRNTSAGGTTVNNSLIHITNPELPFGGTGASGMGNYHGVYGFRAFSHERAVLTQSRPDLLRLFRPPYSSRVRALIKIIVRYFT